LLGATLRLSKGRRVERQHDALADAAHAADGLAVKCVDGRIDRPEDEGAEKADSLEAPADALAPRRRR